MSSPILLSYEDEGRTQQQQASDASTGTISNTVSSTAATVNTLSTAPLSPAPAAAAPAAPAAAAISTAKPRRPTARATGVKAGRHKALQAADGDGTGKKSEEDAAAEWAEEMGVQVTPEVVVEVKRRRVAHKRMLQLLEQGATSSSDLARVAAPLSGDELLQVAEERSLAGKCGSPLCTQPLAAGGAARPRWQARPGQVEAVQGEVFCSPSCQSLVEQYAEVLGNPMQRLKPGAKEQLLVSHKPRGAQPEVAAQVNGVTTMLAEVQERATVAAPVPSAPAPGPAGSSAVEGYVPRALQEPQAQPPTSSSNGTAPAKVVALGMTKEGQVASLRVISDPGAASSMQGVQAPAAVQACLNSTLGADPVPDAAGLPAPVSPTPLASTAPDAIPTAAAAPAAVQTTTAAAAAAAMEPATAQAAMVGQASAGDVSLAPAATDSLQDPLQPELDHSRIAAAVARNLHHFVQDISAPSTSTHSSATSRNATTSGQQPLNNGPACASSPAAPAGQPPLHPAAPPPVRQDAGSSAGRSSSGGLPVKPILKKPSSSNISGAGAAAASVSGEAGASGQHAGDGAAKKKRVSWADGGEQEFEDRVGPPVDTPVLLFTLDGQGSHMEGSLSHTSGHTGHTGDGDGDGMAGGLVQTKQLAGRLEVADASQLQELLDQQLQQVREVPPRGSDHAAAQPAAVAAGMAGGRDDSRSSEGLQSWEGDSAQEAVAPAPRMPKSLCMWFPPAAGGLAVPGKHRQADSGSSSSKHSNGAASSGRIHRFAPNVRPAKGTSTRPLQANGTSNASHGASAAAASPATNSTSSNSICDSSSSSVTSTVNASVQQSCSVASPASVTCSTAGAAPSDGNIALANGHLPPVRGAAALLQPSKPKVVLLEAPPDKALGRNPVLSKLGRPQPPQPQQLDDPAQQGDGTRLGNTQQSRPAAAGTSSQSGVPFASQPRAGGRGHVPGQVQRRPAYPAVVPAREQLPFQDQQQQQDASGVPALQQQQQQRNGVWVIKSDKQHAAPLTSGRKVVKYDEGAGTDEEELGIEQSDAELQHDTRPAARSSSSNSARSHRPAQQGDKLVAGHGGRRWADGSDDDEEEEEEEEEAFSSAGGSDGSDVDSECENSSEGEAAARQPGSRGHKRRSVRADIIYEDEEYVDADACTGGLEEEGTGGGRGARGGGASDSEEDEGFQSLLPFFGAPSKGYRVELSPFNLLWSLLSSWVTRETLVYMSAPAYAPGVEHSACLPAASRASGAVQQGQQQQQQDAARAAGGDQGMMADSEEARMLLSSLPAPSERDAQARAALAGLLEPHVETVMRQLRCPVPVSEVHKRLTGLLRTLVFPGPLPTLIEGQWRLLAVAVLRALAMARLPALAAAFERPSGMQLSDVLKGTGFELYHLSSLVDLLLYA